MIQIIDGHLYDYPKYYDLVYGSDWKAEFDFLEECFSRYSKKRVRRVFEPACGTGRLLIKLAQAGYKVAGNDLNPHAIEFCNTRLARHGFPKSTFVGDMANFTVKKPFDAAFNMINSFRHLPNEAAADRHFRCMAGALVKGGLYVLGLHLTPTVGDRINEEEWSARRGNLAVISSMWSAGIDMKKRVERVGMTFHIYTPTQRRRINDEMAYRTYTAAQMRKLLARAKQFEIAAIHDFTYDVDDHITIDAETEDVVFVLRKK